MVEIQMTGICKDCDKGEFYLWDSEQSVFAHCWHVACKYQDACNRVEMLFKSKEEGAKE